MHNSGLGFFFFEERDSRRVGNARSGTSEKCCRCYLKRGIFIRVVNVEMKKWRERGEERRGREFVTWLRSFPLVSFEVRNFLIISFVFVIIIEEKFLDLILKSLIIYRARVLSYFIDNSIGILSNMLVLWNLLFKSFILFSDYYNYTMF